MSTDNSDINKSNFQLPENYFEQFGEELLAQIALEEALGGKITSGFSTPKEYFQTLSLGTPTLSRKHTKTQGNDTKIVPLFSRKSLWTGLSIAATALLIFSVLWNPTSEPASFDSLDLADIEDYINSEDLAFTTDELADLLSEEAMTHLTENTAILDDELLIDYLEESTDMYQISIE